ncbi:MAG TPA: hypothetical protein VEW95_09240 [Candidatus Limnocylindrales bacterium]|nr:hypothetical protein [Candidatus Limnocylindrales bacterium]
MPEHPLADPIRRGTVRLARLLFGDDGLFGMPPAAEQPVADAAAPPARDQSEAELDSHEALRRSPLHECGADCPLPRSMVERFDRYEVDGLSAAEMRRRENMNPAPGDRRPRSVIRGDGSMVVVRDVGRVPNMGSENIESFRIPPWVVEAIRPGGRNEVERMARLVIRAYVRGFGVGRHTEAPPNPTAAVDDLVPGARLGPIDIPEAHL